MNKLWKYGTLDDAVNKGSSNISLNKIQDEKGNYPVFGAKGFAKNASFFQQEHEYLAIIKDGAGIGRISKYPEKSSVLATMQYLIPKDGFNISFVEYFLGSINFEKHRNGSTIPHIYFKDYKSERFPIISISEQKRIVTILDEAFAGVNQAVANAQKNLANARELFESYLNNVFTQKGDGWVEKILGDVADFKNGLNFTKSSSGQTLPIVGVGDFKNNTYVPIENLDSATIDSELDENYEIIKGDILTVRSNGSKHLIGRCMLVPEIDQQTSYSGFVIRIRIRANLITPKFLLWFMKSNGTIDRLTRGGSGANINNINQGKLASLPLRYPESLPEQLQAVESIDILSETLMNFQTIYQQKLKSLTELKQSILQKAFSGELTTEDLPKQVNG